MVTPELFQKFIATLKFSISMLVAVDQKPFKRDAGPVLDEERIADLPGLRVGALDASVVELEVRDRHVGGAADEKLVHHGLMGGIGGLDRDLFRELVVPVARMGQVQVGVGSRLEQDRIPAPDVSERGLQLGLVGDQEDGRVLVAGVDAVDRVLADVDVARGGRDVDQRDLVDDLVGIIGDGVVADDHAVAMGHGDALGVGAADVVVLDEDVAVIGGGVAVPVQLVEDEDVLAVVLARERVAADRDGLR
jgi:hypothetical protein